MNGRRRAALWCAVAAVLGLALWRAWPTLSPFLIAVGVAYLLDPLVGVMLAVPAAAIAVLLRYAVARCVESPLHLGWSAG